MRLSEAIMLGTTTCRMQAGDWNSCALGAAANAMRLPHDFSFDFGGVRYESYHRRISEIDRTWPWLDLRNYLRAEHSPGGDIIEMFDNEVCKNRMTLEQLVDHIRSIEPACGECNRYECRCQVAQVSVEELATV